MRRSSSARFLWALLENGRAQLATLLVRSFLLCVSALYWSVAAAQTPERVEVVFLDVGQGDAIIVRSPEGTVALIDAGPDGEILNHLRQHDVSAIDIVIASHAHSDHIGGMEQVISSLPVRYYMDNGLPHTTATYMSLMETLAAADITYLEAKDRHVTLGTVDLKMLPVPGEGDQNNNSVGVLVQYGDFKALLTGDSELEELSIGVPDVTVLKAPHHGSRTGVTPGWLSATKPEVVVVSCGRDNPYGHPHLWALRYYQAVAEHVYRTDLDGEITILGARDGTYSVKTEHGAAATGRDSEHAAGPSRAGR
jgi:beta-lactamase superfamily II metal-dependent hydrolase